MRISDWSSDVCSSDLAWQLRQLRTRSHNISDQIGLCAQLGIGGASTDNIISAKMRASCDLIVRAVGAGNCRSGPTSTRSEEHTSELQSLMRISYAVFCLNKKHNKLKEDNTHK